MVIEIIFVEGSILIAFVQSIVVFFTQSQSLERIQLCLFKRIPHGTLKHSHVVRSNGVGFAYDGNDGSFPLQGTKNLNVKVLVENTEQAKRFVQSRGMGT